MGTLKVSIEMIKKILFSGTLLLPLAVCGCFPARQAARFNDGAGLEGAPVLLVPFRETASGVDLWYGESRHGLRVVRTIKMWAENEETVAIFVSGERAAEAQKTILDWAKPRLSDSDWGSIGRSVGARFLVEGTIEAFQLKDPRSIGFFSPTAVVSYRVLDMENSKVAWQRKSWPVSREKDREGQFKVEFGFDNPREIELRLLALIAKRVGEDLYGYYD